MEKRPHFISCIIAFLFDFNDFCRDPLAEDLIVLHKDDRRLIGQDSVFDLDAGKDIHKIQRLIPDEKMGILT